MKILREMLRVYAATHQLSTKELAAEMGFPETTLSRFLGGNRSLSGPSVVRMMVWLFDYSDVEPEEEELSGLPAASS